VPGALGAPNLIKYKMVEKVTVEKNLTNRPLGVKILTVYFSVFAGLFPMGLVVLLYLNSPAEVSIPFYQLILSIILACGIIFSSIGTWQGKGRAPKVLIAFLTIHYILLAWNNYNLLQSGQIEEIQALSRILRAPILVGIAIWYFFFSKAKVFFQK
jgi:hypothetical protein